MKAFYLCDDTQFAETAKKCVTRGFGMEIQSFYDPSYEPANPDAIALHQQAIAPIQKRSFHGPFCDLCTGSSDPMIREVTRVRYEGAVRVATSLGISQLVLHHGYVPGTNLPANWVKRFAKFWHDFLADKPPDLHFYLENHLDKSPQLLSEVIQAIDDPRVRVCLDIGHAHIYSKNGPIEWVTQMKDMIEYLHLHDNHGERDEHLGLGDGTLPLVDFFSALEELAPNAIWALEANPERFESSLDWLAKHRFL
jgi:sugar phosphate isomerase/epimerase